MREVLVADASKRTTKLNAYVSGLGATRRVVLYDTLVEYGDDARGADRRRARARPPPLPPRRARDGARDAGAAAFVSSSGRCSGTTLSWTRSTRAARATRASCRSSSSSARCLGLLLAPLQAALSRSWEYACDRFAVEQTGDLTAFESAFGRLSEANLPDPAPPRLAYLWLFSHPTVPERWSGAAGGVD